MKLTISKSSFIPIVDLHPYLLDLMKLQQKGMINIRSTSKCRIDLYLDQNRSLNMLTYQANMKQIYMENIKSIDLNN